MNLIQILDLLEKKTLRISPKRLPSLTKTYL